MKYMYVRAVIFLDPKHGVLTWQGFEPSLFTCFLCLLLYNYAVNYNMDFIKAFDPLEKILYNNNHRIIGPSAWAMGQGAH